MIQDIDNLRIDGTDHTALAVAALRAIVPDRVGVHDTDGICQFASHSSISSSSCCRWHEAGPESISLVGHDVSNGNAWLIKSRLGNGVVLFQR